MCIKVLHDLLFKHILETEIHIKTQIRKSFKLFLAIKDFLKLLLKYRKELLTTKLLT